ncbi:MAG: B12-binding domain-containing radical SAM protein [Candidatus Omnitrophica bacterium]|nr:B12-binding domain-containing radical SAM protein [Candidatus Omnitrophota bacterium]
MLKNAKIEKVFLIQPPCSISKSYTKEIQPPLGLAYIAAVLEKKFKVKILDAAVEGWHTEISEGKDKIRYGLDFDQIKQAIVHYKPDVIGISCLFSMQSHNAHKIAHLAKDVDKGIITIMGGAHPSVLAAQVLEDDNIDYVVLGEGEYTTLKLFEHLKQGKDLSLIDGIGYRSNNEIIINQKTTFIENLDDLPFPARHLLNMEKYFKINMPHGVTTRKRPNTSMITSRGCPAECIFCAIHPIWGKKFRARSAENVIKEIKCLKEEYGVREIQFEDDNLTFDKKRALEIFDRMITEKLDMLWTTPNGVALWAMDEAMLIKMKESGCYRLCLAIESGDQDVLHKIINKPLDLKKTEHIINLAHKYGFETDAFFVIGFPGETKEQIKRTFKFGRRLKVSNVNYYIATPYPGTRLYDLCVDGNYLVKDFKSETLGVKKGVISTPEFTPSELEKMVSKEKLFFYIRLIFKNPKAFYVKVVKRFVQDPAYVMNMFKAIVKKMLRHPM